MSREHHLNTARTLIEHASDYASEHSASNGVSSNMALVALVHAVIALNPAWDERKEVHDERAH